MGKTLGCIPNAVEIEQILLEWLLLFRRSQSLSSLNSAQTSFFPNCE